MQSIIGWDIGGAHLKGARVEAGIVVGLAIVPCPLWQGIEVLDAAFDAAKSILGDAPRQIVTMTGEMADIFAGRKHGVQALVDCASRHLIAATDLRFYAGESGLVAAPLALKLRGKIASANWHAMASYVGRQHREAILVDMGSTTTDIIPIHEGEVAAIGKDDAGRARHGELVYTGLTRSFVMALAHRAPFDGRWCNLMQEYFANTADIYRILEQLPEGADLLATADGREKTIPASCARLARMIGCEAKVGTLAQWQGLARYFAARQQALISDSAHQVLSRHELSSHAPVICAGIGRPIIAGLAGHWGRASLGFESLIPAAPHLKAQCADSAAVVALTLLAAQI